MSYHPIDGLMATAMENLKQMIDVNTIIGDPLETPDGSVILTVSKVGFGFAAGGSEFMLDGNQQNGNGQSGQQVSEHKHPFGGGSGGGVSITPIAFLVVNASGVKLLHLDESTHLYEKILDLAPQAIEKIQNMLKKNKQQNNEPHQQEKSPQLKKDDLGI
jgi:sporulation protein YtfJ